MAAFEINFSGVTPVVTIDGTTFTNVAEARALQRHGEFPQVVVLFDAHRVTVEGEGNVEAATSQTVSAFLASLDTAQVQQTMNEQMSYDKPPAQLLVEILQELASGN